MIRLQSGDIHQHTCRAGINMHLGCPHGDLIPIQSQSSLRHAFLLARYASYPLLLLALLKQKQHNNTDLLHFYGEDDIIFGNAAGISKYVKCSCCQIVLLFKKCVRILEGFVSKFNVRVQLVVVCIGMCVFKG